MEADKALKIADYFAAFRRRRRLLLGIAVPIITLVTLTSLSLPSIYRSSAVFRLADTSGDQNRQRYIDKYIAGLTDYVLKLPRKEGEIPELEYPSLHVDMITSTILDPDTGHDKVINTGFTVSYDSRDPKISHQVASWLSGAFLRGSRNDALATVASQVDFFNREAEQVRSKATELENKLAEFKRQNFEQLPESGQANLTVKNQTEQELVAVDRDISTQEQNRIFLMQQLQSAQASSGPGANLAALEDEYKRRTAVYDESHPDMIALRRQLEIARRGGPASSDGTLAAELESQKAILAETRTRYSDDHPDVRRLTNSIKVLEARIARGEKVDPGAVAAGNSPVVVQLKTQLHVIDTQIAALRTRSAELRNKSFDLDRRLSATPLVEKQYDTFNRELASSRQHYEQLINQRSEAELRSAAIAAGTADVFTQVQPATEPEDAYRPKRGPIIAVGIVIAAVLAFMSAIAAEMMDGTVRGSRDVSAMLQVSPLAIVPRMRNTASLKRRRLQFISAAGCAVVAVPLLFLLIRTMVR